MKLAIIFIILMFVFSCSSGDEIKNDCYEDLATNETEIYSIIARYWLENTNTFKGNTIVIFRQTYSLKNNHPEISLANRPNTSVYEINAVEDFQQKNQESLLLNNVLKLSNDYQYLSPETNFYKDNLAKDFINAYPNAALLIGFSRIGFSKDYTKAIVYSYNTFDRGSYFELENQNCQWIIKKENPLWHH